MWVYIVLYDASLKVHRTCAAIYNASIKDTSVLSVTVVTVVAVEAVVIVIGESESPYSQHRTSGCVA